MGVSGRRSGNCDNDLKTDDLVVGSNRGVVCRVSCSEACEWSVCDVDVALFCSLCVVLPWHFFLLFLVCSADVAVFCFLCVSACGTQCGAETEHGVLAVHHEVPEDAAGGGGTDEGSRGGGQGAQSRRKTTSILSHFATLLLPHFVP